MQTTPYLTRDPRAGSTLFTGRNARQNDGDEARQEDPVEFPGSPDRGHGRAKPLDQGEIKEVGADEGSEASRNISELGRMLPGDDDGHDRSNHGRDKKGLRDPDAGDGIGHHVNHDRHDAYRHEA